MGASAPIFLFFYFRGKLNVMLELSAIIVFGILAQWIAWRMKIPAIFPLILLGLFMGPLSTLFLEKQWINHKNILRVIPCITLFLFR